MTAEDIVKATGLSRTTVQRRIDVWIREGKLTPIEGNPNSLRRVLKFRREQVMPLIKPIAAA